MERLVHKCLLNVLVFLISGCMEQILLKREKGKGVPQSKPRPDYKAIMATKGLPWWLSSKEFTCNAGDTGSIPESRRCPGGRNGNPLQYSCLGNPMDRRAWQATVYEVARVGNDLATKPMYTHSSTPAWKIPWMEEPGRLQSMGSLSPTCLK